MPFRYFFSFRSKMVYLSLGSISSSRGISVYHRWTAFVVSAWPFLCRAVLTTSTTLSTSRRRLRWRDFWGLDRRHGLFPVALSEVVEVMVMDLRTEQTPEKSSSRLEHFGNQSLCLGSHWDGDSLRSRDGILETIVCCNEILC